MPAADPLHEIEVLLKSRYGLIVLDTDDEDRAEALLRQLAEKLWLPHFVWTPTRGLSRTDLANATYGTEDAGAALDHARASAQPGLYEFRGLGPWLADPAHLRRLAETAETFTTRDGAIVLTGAGLPLHGPAAAASARVAVPPPDVAELGRLLDRVVRDVQARGAADVSLSDADRHRLLGTLRGLTVQEAEKALTRAIVEDGRLTAEDVGAVAAAKRAIVEREGILEYHPVEESLADIADLANLKAWLARRKALIDAPERAAEFGLEFPKGVLLLGVPGCGKSLSAKAVAREWGLPLLRLDPSRLYNKYVGESEKNYARAMATAEKMAPVVLWIDEIEKAFATGGSEEDGGVSTRVLGGFLSWLQERRGDVFVVATANDVERLPPELLRKGRFDEIFFLDLPDGETREAIFRIHLARRGRDPDRFDPSALAAATEGFSGAEVEQVVVAALYTAFGEGAELTRGHLEREAAATRPLSVTRAERIAELRAWAAGRTVPAN